LFLLLLLTFGWVGSICGSLLTWFSTWWFFVVAALVLGCWFLHFLARVFFFAA
jgi:hypothetical protein